MGDAGEAAVRVVANGAARADAVAVEAPLELRVSGRALTVLMRTPGDDAELVTGFLFGEGAITDADDILGIDLSESPRGTVCDVRLAPTARTPGARAFVTSASCGACGKPSLDALDVTGAVNRSALAVPRGVLTALPDKLRTAQLLFARTGGVHASGLFTAAGELVAAREDVGRHNALDKLVGWALVEGRVPLADHILLVSGRVSFELVQKAIVAGLPLLAAVGAPSSLAVELAERFGVTLAGFVRAGALNLYAHAARVVE
jgi:FdhD protein